MNYNYRHHPSCWFGGLVVILGLVAGPVQAQQYIEPTSPSGGSTAWPLNSSANAQVKRGTLIIGEAGGSSKLCLNTNDPNDPNNCISAWSSAGTYVNLKNLVPGNGFPPTDIRAYGVADSGYARIRATGNNLYTVIAEANYNPSTPATSTALVATDGGNSGNYAANFQGKVFVGFPSSATDAKLCLNGEFGIITDPANSNFGKGCITAWSQIAPIATAGNYVLLQSTTSIPNPQSGQAALSGGLAVASASSSALVIGAPASGTSTAITCGDGICNSNECSLNTVPACAAGNGNYCAIDCDRTPPGNVGINADVAINRNTGYYTITGFEWTLPPDSDYAGTRIIRTVNNPPAGPTSPGAMVIDRAAPLRTFSDTAHLNYNTVYYYYFYAYDSVGNYSSGVYLRFQISSGGSGGGSGGGGGVGGGVG